MKSYKCFGYKKEILSGYTGYTCPDCGENLNILYDYFKIKKEFSVEKLKKNTRNQVWRYRLLFPFNSLDSVPPLDFPLSPLYRAEFLEKELGLSSIYLKDDTRQPSASFKDRASSVVIAVARERGEKVLSCASTGNAGSSLACMAAACSMKAVIYVPESVPAAKLAQLKVYGAEIKKVPGSYDRAYELCLKESNKYNYYNRSTGYNPFTREGKKSVSFEIWEQLDFRAPGTIFVPAGDGNILSGVWKGFEELKIMGLIQNSPQIFAVQSSASDSIARTMDKIKKSGYNIKTSEDIEKVQPYTIADSISVERARDGLAAVRSLLSTDGKAVRVDDKYLVKEVLRLASEKGIFAEASGAASVAGLRKLKSEMKAKIKEPAVCLITGSGLKDIEKVI